MTPLKKAFAAAGFVALGYTSSALAEDVLQTSAMPAVAVAGQDDMNYQTFYMEETVNGDRSTVRGRALVDRAVGITCEWKDIGRSEADADGHFHIIGRKPESIGCVRSVTLPEKWVSAPRSIESDSRVKALFASGVNPADEEQVAQFEKAMQEATGTIVQKKSDRNVLLELIDNDHPHAIAGMLILHTWNIATNQVCIDTLEKAVDLGKEVQTVQKLGCFPITNNMYLDRVLKGAGIRPS